MASSDFRVPGTDRPALIRSLTTAGWLLLGGSIGMIAYQVRQVRDLGGSSAFGGDVWDRRIEVLSFVMLPPNLVVLMPAVAVAVVAAWLAGPAVETWLLTLLRLCVGIATAFAVIGAVSIVSIFVRDEAGPSDWGDIYLRLGGISMAAGLLVLCRAARHQPSRRGQSPRLPVRKCDRQSSS